MKTSRAVGNVLVDQRPRHAELTRDGSRLCVSSEIGGTVRVIDPAAMAVTDHNSNNVSVIDVSARRVAKSVQAGQQPWGVVVGPE